MNDILAEPCELVDADLDLVVGGVGLLGELDIIPGKGFQLAFTLLSNSAKELFHGLLNVFVSPPGTIH